MDWLFLRMTRHLVHELQRGSLKLAIYRRHVGHATYEYELELLERKRYDAWKKRGSVRLHEADAVGWLLKEAAAYMNGLR